MIHRAEPALPSPRPVGTTGSPAPLERGPHSYRLRLSPPDRLLRFGLAFVGLALLFVLSLAVNRPGRGGRPRPCRRTGDRPDPCGRAQQIRWRRHPDLDRAGPRRHRAPHRGRAQGGRRRPNWIVFALTNDSDEQIDRLLVAPHFRLVGSGLVWPDLGASRIAADHAEPGLSRPSARRARTPTSSASRSIPARASPSSPSCAPPNLPQLYLWDPDAYKDKVNS